MYANDLTWLAGLLEGDGSFLAGPPCKPNRPRIFLSMVDIDVVQHAAALLDVRSVVTKQFPFAAHNMPAYVINLSGSRAIKMMRTLLPLMSERRVAQINTSIESYSPKRRTKHDHTTGAEWTDKDRLATPLGHDLFWLAGLLEAEGSFLSGYPTKANQPRVQLTTTDEDVIGWAATWLGVGYTPIKPRDNSHPSYKQAYFACVSAGPAVNIMHKLYPLMGSRRQAQIERALASYDPHKHKRNTSKLTDEQVLEFYERAQSGEQQKVIAAEYNIDRSTIADIKRGKSWSWLTGNKPLGSRSFLPPKV